MLRANHFVHDHEQRVRSAPRGTASQLAPEIGQNGGRVHFQRTGDAQRGLTHE